MVGMVERLSDAMNSHDAARMTALFADDYVSVQPAHPGREFTGRAQVFTNWTSVFEGVPDFHTELVASVVDGEREWAELDWHGTHTDASPFAMRGVVILNQRGGRIAGMWLYMEPVDDAGDDIDAAVQELYRPPRTDKGTPSS